MPRLATLELFATKKIMSCYLTFETKKQYQKNQNCKEESKADVTEETLQISTNLTNNEASNK